MFREHTSADPEDSRFTVASVLKENLGTPMDLVLPDGGAGPWIAAASRMPTLEDVLVLKREPDGWMGLVSGLHNGRQVAALAMISTDFQLVILLLEDGGARQDGLTHWRAWPRSLENHQALLTS